MTNDDERRFQDVLDALGVGVPHGHVDVETTLRLLIDAQNYVLGLVRARYGHEIANRFAGNTVLTLVRKERLDRHKLLCSLSREWDLGGIIMLSKEEGADLREKLKAAGVRH